MIHIRLASHTSLAARPGGLIESGYPSLSGPYLSDGSYMMEMGSTISSQMLKPRRNLS